MILENATLTLLGFAFIIGFLLLFIAKFKWHVFLAMLTPIMLFALIPGVSMGEFIDAFESGFGSTLKSIAVVIVLGSIMAEALKHTGAIQVITKSMINLVGKKRMPLALTFSGFILGIAVFSDVAYVILNPLIHSAASLMNTSMVTMSTGLVGALQITHAIVPPTPGPLAATALIGADLGKIIVYGSIVGFVGSMAGYVYGKIIGKKVYSPPSKEFIGEGNFLEDPSILDGAPSTFRSYLPIIVPIVLISGESFLNMLAPGATEGGIGKIIQFLGWAVVSISIGVLLSYSNIKKSKHKEDAKDNWVEEGLRTSAMIIVVTGLGGSLSQILRGTPAVDAIAEAVVGTGMPPILLPFILGIIGNMITGSTTVGVITSASLVSPMLSQLGLSPEVAMLAGSSGAVIIKYINSSYFWVCTSLSKMELKNALISYGGVTFVGGLFCFLTTWVLHGIGLI